MSDLRTDLWELLNGWEASSSLPPAVFNLIDDCRNVIAKHPAPTADRDEVAEALHQGTCEGRLFAHNTSVTRCKRAADALLARFEMRRKA